MIIQKSSILPSYITSLNIPAQYKSRVDIAESFNDASEHFRELFKRLRLPGLEIVCWIVDELEDFSYNADAYLGGTK